MDDAVARPRTELDALVAEERRLERLLDDARAEAAERVAAARAAAAHDADALQATIETELARLVRAIDADAAQRVERVRRDADAEVARYRAIDGRELRELAGVVADRLVALLLRGSP